MSEQTTAASVGPPHHRLDGSVGPAGVLWLEFCGEEVRVVDHLSVGRSADLVIDDNRYLHRCVFELVADGPVWWLRNTGARTVLSVVDLEGRSATTVAPGAACVLAFPTFGIRFAAGPTRYELTGTIEDLERDADLRSGADPSAPRTLEFGCVDLNPEQRLLLLALCEPQLLDPAAAATVPTNRQASHRLGWSATKFHRKLDNLCAKFARAGVVGVHGDVAELAADRRLHLARHAIDAGLVSVDDLGDLDAGSDDGLELGLDPGLG